MTSLLKTGQHDRFRYCGNFSHPKLDRINEKQTGSRRYLMGTRHFSVPATRQNPTCFSDKSQDKSHALYWSCHALNLSLELSLLKPLRFRLRQAVRAFLSSSSRPKLVETAKTQPKPPTGYHGLEGSNKTGKQAARSSRTWRPPSPDRDNKQNAAALTYSVKGERGQPPRSYPTRARGRRCGAGRRPTQPLPSWGE